MSSTVRTMKPIAWFLFVVLVVTTCASAIPKPNEHKTSQDRVHEQELSHQEHKDEEGHNNDYDHDAFLGEEDAREFDQLTPEESKERLAIIYTKIDKDKDGFVTDEELREWIKHVQNKYITTDTNRQWDEQKPTGDRLDWETYKKRTYGFLDDQEEEGEDEDGYSYKEMVKRDERRWKKADSDGDNKLTKDEFSHFLHPEEVEHMRDIVIDETLEDIDKDKDGYISLEEYIGDMWPNQDDEEEPEWVKTERDQFHSFRDKNKDGRMDREEVMDWIIPPDYDHSEAESKHLIYESDVDRDGKLSKEEVISKYDLFVGSQATDFGEALTRHDEF